uniref:Uncharacterized protein n=1 Tax=Meloidogyne enterolobii TaxID=390850 RepID=A0A6V7WPB1_MELEN|nr:unnamed protein product [Meloidogyne enterolobii]
MSFDLLNILFKFDYFVCILIGFPLNIILIVLIIFKTPEEMKTHSRILIQNCVLDILILITQLFVQVFYLLDKEGNTIVIFPNGIMLNFVNENFNPFIIYIVALFWYYLVYFNLNGLCVQFIYRYLVLNRNLKINFLRYLLMLSVALFMTLLLMLDAVLFRIQYSFGGIKYFDDFNKNIAICSMQNRIVFFQFYYWL